MAEYVFEVLPEGSKNQEILNKDGSIRAVRLSKEMAGKVETNSKPNIQLSSEETVKAPVETPPAAPVEQSVMTPDVSINSFSIGNPAPSPVIPETPVMESPVVEKPVIEPEISMDIPATPVPEEPVATQIDTPFVPPIAEVPNVVAEPEPMQNNGFGVPAPVVNNITMPEENVKENIVNLNDEAVINYLKEKLARSAEIDKLRSTVESQKIELEAKDKKLSAVNNALAQIQTAVNSSSIEEPGEVYKKAA